MNMYNKIMPTSITAAATVAKWETQAKQEQEAIEIDVAHKKYKMLPPLQQYYFDTIWRPFTRQAGAEIGADTNILSDLEEFIEKVVPNMAAFESKQKST